MKRYLLTSPKLVGQMDILYNPEGMLVIMDLTQAQCDEKQVRYLLMQLPIRECGLPEFCAKTSIQVQEAAVEVTFNQWWNKYGLKRNKDGAVKIWDKLAEGDKVRAFFSLDAYERYLKRTPWLSKMYPDTYLRGRHFNDEWDTIKSR